MNLEHCYRCREQVEFRRKDDPERIDERSQRNYLEAMEFDKGATVVKHVYCDHCFYEVGDILQSKGYLPRGMNGLMETENG